jgi:hypothetical protein
MRSRIFILLSVAFLPCLLYSQNIQNDVIATSGNSYQSPSAILSWTLGEGTVETYSSGELLLSQGFQQSFFTIEEIPPEPDSAMFDIIIFPNPTPDQIHILISDDNESNTYVYSLYDDTGRLLVDRHEIDDRDYILNLSFFPTEIIYLSIIRTNTRYTRTFKVIKVN